METLGNRYVNAIKRRIAIETKKFNDTKRKNDKLKSQNNDKVCRHIEKQLGFKVGSIRSTCDDSITLKGDITFTANYYYKSIFKAMKKEVKSLPIVEHPSHLTPCALRCKLNTANINSFKRFFTARFGAEKAHAELSDNTVSMVVSEWLDQDVECKV
jgi:hypothetical protein